MHAEFFYNKFIKILSTQVTGVTAFT